MNKNKIMQACIITAGILLSSQGFSHGGGGHHGGGGYHGGHYGGHYGGYRGYNGYHNGYHNGYYGNRGYYGGYGGYYGPGYYPLPPVVIGAARYYNSCYFIKKCRHHHCWRQKVCR